MTVQISVDPANPVPIHRQIFSQVSGAVLCGRLAPNEPLPTVRALAAELSVNKATISRAYSDLAHDGIVERHRGKRLRVVSQRRPIYTRREMRARLKPFLSSLVCEALMLGFAPEEIQGEVKKTLKELLPRKGQRDGNS